MKIKQRLLHIILGMLCLIFIVSIRLELGYNDSIEVTQASAGLQSASKLDETENRQNPVIKPLSDYDEIIERPLFMENRRSYSHKTASEDTSRATLIQTNPETNHESLLLSAVVITNSDKIALVRSAEDNELHKLKEGDTLEGWKLVDVQADRILIRKGRETPYLYLGVDGPNQMTTYENYRKSAFEHSFPDSGDNTSPALNNDAAIPHSLDSKPEIKLPGVR